MPKGSKRHSDSPSAAKKDSRFASFETNPRYRLPSKGRVKTKIDKRFQRVFEDEDFATTAKLDRYGRKLKSDSKKKALRDIYEPEEKEDAKVDDDDAVRRELKKADASYDPARGGGFSSSESDSESDDDDEDDQSDQENKDEGGANVSKSTNMQRVRDEQNDIEVGEITKRIAVVNLDWDNIKAADLMVLFSSFVPQGGRIQKVSIYPSEFGKERMRREEVEGPPKEIFKAAAKDDDSEDGDNDSEEEEEKIKKDLLQEGDDQDFDNDALRSYQLDRLRYYYAVVICSDLSTAEKLYNACDGTEYLASSNFVDLRFIPDDVTFDDEPREECDSVVANYQPTEFVTDALQHSRVKLTWDVAPDEAARKENIRKAFTGSRADLEENDFRAYLASDSEDEIDNGGEGGAVDAEAAVVEDEPKLSKRELKAKKLREALGLGSEPMTKSSMNIGPVGDMQVTFTAALMGDEKKKKDPQTEETTVEKYIRKERERKARKKEKAVSKRNGGEADEDGDEGAEPEEDLGFDDPFFTTDEPVKVSKSAERKEERRRRREEKEATAAEDAAQKAQLEKIMADGSENQAGHLDHFNMDEITRAEKKKSKKFKKKGKKQDEDHGGLQEGFEMNVNDDRFKAVFEDHDFAIDPSNPKFKATPGMKKLLEEGRKKRKNKSDDFDAPPEVSGKAKKQKIKTTNDELSSLVESIRQKAQAKKK